MTVTLLVAAVDLVTVVAAVANAVVASNYCSTVAVAAVRSGLSH